MEHWGDDLRDMVGSSWRWIRWRLEWTNDIAAMAILVVATGYGIHLVAGGNVEDGVILAGLALVVLVAWIRSVADAYRYERWWWEANETRRQILASAIEDAEEDQ